MAFLTALQIAIPTDLTTLLWILIVFIIVGLIAIVALGFLIAFPIAVFASSLVWVFTGGLSGGGDLFLTAVTFLGAALITSISGSIWRATARIHMHSHGQKQEA